LQRPKPVGLRIYLDANVPMYAAGLEHPNKRPSERFMVEACLGSVTACGSAEVLQEILHRYTCLRNIELGCAVYDRFVVACKEIFAVRAEDAHVAREILCEFDGISARDAIHAAVMLNHGIEFIASFDRHFDRIPGIKRLEPM
jgi:uncharacterized protein